jgi:hypothetical protein
VTKIVPKNWRDFQHYKDRNPPWIRLHRGLLDNKDFQRLPVASRALAPMLWLIASESVDGVINADPDDLAFRLRTTEKEISVALRPLLEKGFFLPVQDASTPLAGRLQSAVPETEAETETSQRPEALTEAEAPSAATWDSYAKAYASRYGAEPVRNKTVNAQLAQVVGKLGAEEAPFVAAFYVGHQGSFYVRAMHAVGPLLRDAEKLRTEWFTNRQVTMAGAIQADRTQTNFNAFAPLLAKAQAEEDHAQH